MASAGDAIDEIETTTKKKRISDCLRDSDGADEEVAAASPPSQETPRLSLPRFTCERLRFVRLGRKGGGGMKEVTAAEKSEAASVDSLGALCVRDLKSQFLYWPLFLLAKTCVELNKMAEVRAQIEALLKEMREQARTKSTDHVVVPRTCNLPPPSTASSSRAWDTDTNGHAASSSAMEMASSSESEKPSEDEGSTRMDVLEEEEKFDIETGQFQLNCNNTTQETSESSDDEFIELEGGFGGGAGNLRRGLEDGDEEHGAQHGDAVSALELERRLHELLHERDRERIEELESALRRAERKLVEKKMEVRLWKDTAKLALQQPQDGHAVTWQH